MTLQPGQHLWWHYRRSTWQPGEPQGIAPTTVVKSDSQALVAWLAPESLVLKTVLDTGEDTRSAPLAERFTRDKSIARVMWRGEGILLVAPTGMPWSVWLFWEPGWQFAGWYINLETPVTREGPNVYSEDHVLDVWVTPDRVCHRKDEDELEAAVEQGRFSVEDAALITRNAGLAEEAVAAWESPFADGWEGWRPDPAWTLPPLPEGITWDFDLVPVEA